MLLSFGWIIATTKTPKLFKYIRLFRITDRGKEVAYHCKYGGYAAKDIIIRF